MIQNFPDNTGSLPVWQGGPPGLFNTNSYLSSGWPYASGSILSASLFSTNNAQVQFDFPQITRNITVINQGTASLRVHWNNITDGQVLQGNHYTTLPNQKDSMTFGYRVNKVFVSLTNNSNNGQVEITAELTNIPKYQMIAITGSGLTI